MSSGSRSATPISVPGQRELLGSDFPYALACDDVAGDRAEAAEWIRRRSAELRARLAEHGALLLRGLPLADHDDFDAAVRAFGYAPFSFEDSLSNAVRATLTERVFTANEAPASAIIHLHHELAQTTRFPDCLLFFCEVAASGGGATVLCRSDALWERLCAVRSDFARACETRGVRYTTRMPGSEDGGSGQGRSWRSTFSVSDREQADAAMGRLGYRWRWCDDDVLEATTPALPAVRATPAGRKAFFNQIIAAATGWSRNEDAPPIRHGDDTPIDPDGLRDAVAIAESIAFDLQWQRGDVALVDNRTVMHGRRGFTGRRRVLVAFASDPV